MLLKLDEKSERKGISTHKLPVLVERPKIIKKKTSKAAEMAKQLDAAYKLIEELEQELANEREARFQEGFDAGKKIGFKEGLAEINAQIERFGELIKCIKSEQNQIVQNTNDFILGFILKIVEDLVGTGRLEELGLSENKLNNIIDEMVNLFPGSGKYIFHVHKETIPVLEANLEKVKSHFNENIKVTISEAPELKPSDCIVETDFGVLDGCLKTHFRQIKNAFSEKMN